VGHVAFTGFTDDPNTVFDLTGGVGGFKDTNSVLSALTSDGRGGTLLSFGHGSWLDVVATDVSQLHAANFQIT
jgi:hypothetical protein